MKKCCKCKSIWPNEAKFLKHLPHCFDYRQAGGPVTERPTEVKEMSDSEMLNKAISLLTRAEVTNYSYVELMRDLNEADRYVRQIIQNCEGSELEGKR